MNVFDLDIEQDFEDCFRIGGSAVVDCHCGKEHVAIDSEYFDWSEGDFEIRDEYRERAKNSENVILHSEWDYIGEIEIDNKIFADCCDCEGWKPYMEFILVNRVPIKDFLLKVSTKAKIALQHEKTFDILKDTKL